MLILGVVLAAAAVALFIVGRVMAAKMALIRGTETSKASVIEAEAKAVADEIGSGSYAKLVEVQGTAQCESPLLAEFSNTPCIHFETTVVREYEESYVQTDSDGRSSTGTRRGSETLSTSKRSCPFFVEDGSGRIEVDPTGAEFHLETTVSRFEPGEGERRVGSYVLRVALAAGGGRRTIGYRFTERCFPVGRKAYVLGEATDAGGQLRICKGQ
ncbi:MAG TPA: E3 ubiquitin ligase family protein, partial [Rectinemataceae bacterium]|nr:E3 ubiquitin ligase family protein [Rectinemataceae bacterium]